MKIQLYLLIFIAMISSEESIAQTNKAFIEVASIEKNEGQIYVALFKPGSKFPEVGHQYVGKIIPVSSVETIVTDFELPAGEYAVAVFQDLNGNKKLDTNFLGIPKEPYAFSNNIKPKFSSPQFEECKFQVTAVNVNLRINLIN